MFGVQTHLGVCELGLCVSCKSCIYIYIFKFEQFSRVRGDAFECIIFFPLEQPV